MRTHFRVLALTLLAAWTAPASAAFKCTLADGSVGFQDTPCAEPAAAPPPEPADFASDRILFILDGSGSMWGRVDKRPKITIAQEVMSELVRELPDSFVAGLQVYGHRRKGDCTDIETLVPLGQGSTEMLVRQINGIKPKG